MALSDKLTKLAAQAKELEDRAAAAKAKTKADLEQEVKSARDAAQAMADDLRKDVEAGESEISEWWAGVRASWDAHVKEVRKRADEKKATLDLKAAQRAAKHADDDAAFAIDYACTAVEEAEYAVLRALLAHKEADDLAEATTKS